MPKGAAPGDDNKKKRKKTRAPAAVHAIPSVPPVPATSVSSLPSKVRALLLQDAVAPAAAKELHELAVRLFDVIQAGGEKVPGASLSLIAKAFAKAAEAGSAKAWVDLGRCLWNGWGIQRDCQAALDAYQRSAQLGYDYGAYMAAYNLYWSFGRWDDAHAYALEALQGGDPRGDVRHLLGLMAYHGRGCKKNLKKSYRLHEEAARRGNPDAMFELHVLLSTGQGCEKDELRARRWLNQAAERGHGRAAYNMGAFYASGNGFPQDFGQAIRWYEQASGAGNGKASATLAAMLLLGQGLVPNESRAREYVALAEVQGFDARAFLHQLGLPME